MIRIVKVNYFVTNQKSYWEHSRLRCPSAETPWSWCLPLSSFGSSQWHLLSVFKQARFIVFVHGGHWTGWRGQWPAEMPRYCDRTRQRRRPYLASHSFKPLRLLCHTLCTLCHCASLTRCGIHNLCDRRRQRKEGRQWIFSFACRYQTMQQFHENG